MSAHSKAVADAAKENPELLGTTNTGTREKQSPATASKVERSMVQAEVLSPTDVVGNVSNRDDRAIDEEFTGTEDTTIARMESKGREVPEVPNPANRFAPNNVGLEPKAEGQRVGKEEGVEVNRESGRLAKDADGLGRTDETIDTDTGKMESATAADNGDNVPEEKAAEDNTKRANELRDATETRADGTAEVPGVAVYASPTVNEDGEQVEEELVNTTDKVETNSLPENHDQNVDNNKVADEEQKSE